MPRPYSRDLRTRALAAVDAGERPGAVAERFCVARATAYLWLKQRREEGRTAPKPARGGPAPVIRGAVADALGRLVEADDGLTLAEYAQALEAEAGVRAAPSMLCRALQRLNLPRKKRLCARPSGTRPRSSGRGPHGGTRPSPGSPPGGWCSSMKARRSPTWCAATAAARAVSEPTAARHAASGTGSR
jgi:transposase